jgi:hypothetical protein
VAIRFCQLIEDADTINLKIFDERHVYGLPTPEKLTDDRLTVPDVSGMAE